MSKKNILHLQSIWPNQDWPQKHQYVFDQAGKSGLAVCGSICVGLAKKEPTDVEPGDLDFVAPNQKSARAFIAKLEDLLLKKPGYYRILVNTETDFCPSNAQTHFRIVTAFWKPICIFVLKSEDFPIWYAKGGIRCQAINDVIRAGNELTERDSKPRQAQRLAMLDEDSAVNQESDVMWIDRPLANNAKQEPITYNEH